MIKRLALLFFLIQFLDVSSVFAQRTIRAQGSSTGSSGRMGQTGERDTSLNKTSDADSIYYYARHIRYTNFKLLKEGTQTRGIDTTVKNFQNFSPLYQPENPTIGLGSAGIAYREMLFNPTRTIGFDAGFHSLDLYKLIQDSIKFYRAKSPYTELYYVNGRIHEQVFKVTHSQNVKPNLNVGAHYNRLTGDGFYVNQKADHLNAALFAWYESPKKRYNIIGDVIFNTLKAGENGSTRNDTIFKGNSLDKRAEPVFLKGTRADRPMQTWRQTQFLLKQLYYLGRIDSLQGPDSSERILPTQRVSHTLTYTRDQYKFFRKKRLRIILKTLRQIDLIRFKTWVSGYLLDRYLVHIL